jgi:hypothetical protein
MASPRAALGSFVALVASSALVACSTQAPNGEACAPGDFVRVALPDGGVGYDECALDGSTYAPYDGPDPNIPIDAGDSGLNRPCEAGAPYGYMCAGCSVDTDCDPGHGLECKIFPSRGGGVCTLPCQTDIECPPPALGCGANNGHCRPP